MSTEITDLPGAELIEQGLDDLGKSVLSIPALLICIGRTRLENAGLIIPRPGSGWEWPQESEVLLYELIQREGKEDAYSFYNSLIRRLISFEQALEHRYDKISKRS